VTTEEPVEVRTDLVSLTLTESVALSASCLEEVGTLLCVTYKINSISEKFFGDILILDSWKGSGRKLAAMMR
jgi:hypothetical protein